MKTASLQVTQQEPQPGVLVIALTGKMMLSESAAVEDAIAQGLAGGKRKFIIDLSGLTHIDSTGIGVFIAGLSQIGAAGGAMAMAGASGMVREGFRVTRLDKVFRFFPDVETARAGM
jgi:anti-anti-sigma factor